MRTRTFLLVLSSLTLMACAKTTPTPTDTTDSSASSASSAAAMSAVSAESESAWQWDGQIVSGSHTVTLETSKGNITIALDADVAPKTVTNFLALAKSGYYNDLTFHRVIPGFMIQGGDPSGNGTGGESIFGDTFVDEVNPGVEPYTTGYRAGVIAMANRGPDTNGSQFFIMETDYPLPPNYTIFGRVTKGQEVVSAIAEVERDSNDKPLTPVTFTVKVVK